VRTGGPELGLAEDYLMNGNYRRGNGFGTRVLSWINMFRHISVSAPGHFLGVVFPYYYTGRPLAIFDGDYDALLPNEEEVHFLKWLI
jgi:hypothetical protein